MRQCAGVIKSAKVQGEIMSHPYSPDFVDYLLKCAWSPWCYITVKSSHYTSIKSSYVHMYVWF
uniref:Uncharacterized protein n=1 Tax=Anguilla anguilla TaxID=7936 RepID=A0A0E9RPQ4_ANGAN